MTCAEALNKATSEVFGENKKNLKVLDLGCGTGLVGKVLKEKFGFTNLVGLDASEEMLEIAKNRAIYNKHISTFVTNERVNDIKTGEFDAVVSAGVFTIGLVRPNAFDEVLRWIKPGLSSVNHSSLMHRTSHFLYNFFPHKATQTVGESMRLTFQPDKAP